MKQMPDPIICPECGRHLGLVDENALYYPAGEDRYLIITAVKPTKKLVIACPCMNWFKVWNFKKTVDTVTAQS